MGNNQSGGPDNRFGGLKEGGGVRRHRMMSETARVAGQVLPNPDGPPMMFDVSGYMKICLEPLFQDGHEDKSGECPVVFRWSFTQTLQPRNVQIVGSWDNWQTRIPMVKSTNDFSTIIDLQPGQYEYKFHVDGQWVVDDNQGKTKDAHGNENNMINIQDSDFAVFEALDEDFQSSTAGEVLRGESENTKNHDTPNDR